jgi:hypothetical protein
LAGGSGGSGKVYPGGLTGFCSLDCVAQSGLPTEWEGKPTGMWLATGAAARWKVYIDRVIVVQADPIPKYVGAAPSGSPKTLFQDLARCPRYAIAGR